jgi:hypothetical protein
MVNRDDGPGLAGYMQALRIEHFTDEDHAADPALPVVRRLIDSLGGLDPGESALLMRTWMARDTYQLASGVQTHVMAIGMRTQMTTPNLRLSIMALADVEYWAPFNDRLGLQTFPEPIVVGDRRFTLLYLDVRRRNMAALLGSFLPPPAAAGDEHPRALPPPLARQTFAALVRAALRDLHDPTALQHNPLVDSRLILGQSPGGAPAGERADILRRVLLASIETLAGAPRGERGGRALHRTYVEPAAVQKQAAADLGLSFSSYRRDLAHGIELLVERLWPDENPVNPGT